MRIVRHRLRRDDGSDVPYRRSPNQSSGITPVYALVHFTAGASAESSIAWLLDPAARASAHVVVARDGALTQLVAFDRRSWHAGRSRWEDREDLNRWSFGIELDNAGPLQHRADGWYSGWGARIDDSEVVEASHRHGGSPRAWHAFPAEQLHAAADVVNLLVRRYALEDVLGHDDVAPGRKSDPGPAFPMESFRARALGRDARRRRADHDRPQHPPGTRDRLREARGQPASGRHQARAAGDLWLLAPGLRSRRRRR